MFIKAEEYRNGGVMRIYGRKYIEDARGYLEDIWRSIRRIYGGVYEGYIW